jgi:hypothetical protein
VGVVNFGREGGIDSLPQNLVESGAFEPDGKGDFLIFFGTPTAAEHHPQKVGLDPTHASQAEFIPAKVTIFRREMADGWFIGLIDNY